MLMSVFSRAFPVGLAAVLGLTGGLSSCVDQSGGGPDGFAPVYTYEVVKEYPHDPRAFTQGLVYEDGALYEGTGLRGSSSLRKVDLDTGQVLLHRALDARYFGEGVAVVGDRIVQLTWQSGLGFVYDRESFEPEREFGYEGEGWGLTFDGERLIMSDGTADLRFLDPDTLVEMGRVEVRDLTGPVSNLNELEFVEGEVYANVWRKDLVARIDPDTGRVKGWIDLTGLLRAEDRSGAEDVLNGIAHDAENGRLFVTGKLWPKLFEIRLVPKR